MRSFLATGLAILATVSAAQAAVLGFADVANGTYQGSLTAKDVDDIVSTGSDSMQWGVRSYDGTSGNDSTVAENQKVITNNWQGKIFLRPVANSDADAGNDVVFTITSLDLVKRWDDADCVVTGYKADGSTVTTTIATTGNMTFPLPTFTDLKEIKLDFNGGANTAYAFVDNVVYSVPEPASLGLVGLVAIAALRRVRV